MKAIMVCDRCGQAFEGDKEEHSYHIGPSWNSVDMVLCDECHDTHYSTCDACGNTVTNTLLNRVYDADTDGATDEVVCINCENEGDYYRCADCGRSMRGEYVHVNAPYAGIVSAICPACAQNGEYTYCDACGNLFEDSHCSYSEYHGSYYCEECEPCDAYCIRSYGDGHPDGPEFFGAPSDGLYFGTEIEMNDGGCCDENAALILDILEHNHAHCEEDCSIARGFETITQPMSLSYFNEHFSSKLESAYKEWRGMGYSNDNAGFMSTSHAPRCVGKRKFCGRSSRNFKTSLLFFRVVMILSS